MKKRQRLPDQVERSKRSSAGAAHSTKGRATFFDDKTIYNRKTFNLEVDTGMTDTEFLDRKAEILSDVPAEFHSAFSFYAYQEGHSAGYHDILNILIDLIDMIKQPLEDYTKRIKPT